MTCSEAGVLGVVPGLIGTIQATEAIKWILRLGTSLTGRLLTYDAAGMQFDSIAIDKNPDCLVCGRDPKTIRLIDYEGFCGSPSSDHTISLLPKDAQITALELKARLDTDESVILVDVRRSMEWAIVHLDNSILIPLEELEHRLGELNPLDEIVVLCQAGHRSARAVALLRDRGFAQTRNLTGGLIAWAHDVDPSLPQY